MNILDELRKPFDPSYITWKPGATKDTRALALAYADLRAYMYRLDEVCGSDWSVMYEPWGEDRIICRLTIGGSTRSSTGEMGAQDEKNEIGGTVAEAQAFKRACVMFGLGRYLYNFPSGWVDIDPKTKQFTDAAKAKLAGMVKQHYREAMKGIQDTPTATQQAATPANGASSYAHLIDKLTGDCLERANRARNFHAQGKGPATPEQYRYLSGVIDDLVGVQKAHNAILEVFVGRAVNGENPPSILLASKLLDALVKEKPEEVDGQRVMVPNSAYSVAAVNCVHTVWRMVLEANGQQSLFEPQPEAA